MNPPSQPIAGIADLFNQANAIATTPIKTASTTMPTRRSAPLHKDRGDQAILVKWFFSAEEIEKFIPDGIHWDGAVDQDRIEAEHAAYARSIGQNRKSVDNRIRENAVDTADWKVESNTSLEKKAGSVSADGLWEDLEAHGFKLLRAHAYVSVRGTQRRGVIELRFVHDNVYDVCRAALETALGVDKGRGLAPRTRIEDKLRKELKRMMYFRAGFCTVFSNTATADPCITVNFRARMGSGGVTEVFELKDGVYSFRKIA